MARRKKRQRVKKIRAASLTHASTAHILSLVTVIETPEFRSRAKYKISDEKRVEIIDFLSASPEAGAIIAGTGGCRKIRFSDNGKGKSGGIRVIYFYYNDTAPLFLLSMFSKNEKSDLTAKEKNELKKVLTSLVKEYEAGVRRYVQGRKQHP